MYVNEPSNKFTHEVYTTEAVDAPMLSAVYFVKTDKLINLFVCTGCADLCEELPKDGMECQEDPHGFLAQVYHTTHRERSNVYFET